MFETIKNTWAGIKNWFKHSWSLFLARSTVLAGAVTSAVGYLDFSPLWSTLQTGTWFTKQQLIAMGIGFAVQGVMLEVGRRSGTKEVAGRLIPTQAALEPDVKIKTKVKKTK